MAYGAMLLKANPATTLLGAAAATGFMVGTAAYGALTGWGGELYSKEWVDYGYCIETKKSEKRVSLWRSEPHPCAKTEQQIREEEHRKAEQEQHYQAEQQKKIEDSHKKGVEWVGGTTGGDLPTPDPPDDKVGSSDTGADGKRPVFAWLAGALAVLIAIAIAVVLMSGGSGSDDEAGNARANSEPRTQTASGPSGPTSPTTPPQLVSGPYAGSVVVAPGKDPSGHSCCVKPTMRWDVLQTRDTTTGTITIALNGVLDGLNLSGPLSATGQPFSAVGMGTVAGYPNTAVGFDGTVTAEKGLHGTLVVGGNGSLPTGKSITFDVNMQKAG